MEIERMSAPREESAQKDATLSDVKALSSVLTLTQGMLAASEKNQAEIQKLLETVRRTVAQHQAVEESLSQKWEGQIAAQLKAADLQTKMLANAAQSLTLSAENGANDGVKRAMRETQQQALAAFKQGVTPDLSELKRVTQGISEAGDKVKAQMKYLTWKAVGIYALIALVPLVVLLVWDNHLVEKIKTEQITINNLNENGGKVKFTHCGDDHRLCIQVDEKAGSFGGKDNYWIIKGY